MNKRDIQKVIQGDLVRGVEVESKESMDSICEPYLAGKQHRVSVPKAAIHCSSKPLELVHSDVHGPLPVQTRHHFKYWIMFIDDYSVEVYALALDLLLFFAYFALFVLFIIVPGLSHITHSLLLHHYLFHFVVVFNCCSITCLY